MVIFLYGGVEKGGKKCQIFFHAQILIEREPTRHIADYLPDFPVIFYYIMSVHQSYSTVG